MQDGAMNLSPKRVSKSILRLALMVVLCAFPESPMLCQESSTVPVFSSPVLDLGMVVQDLEASAAFYGKVLGCQEVEGFSVASPFATSIGLVDHMDVTARVFLLGKGEKQSRIKMMSFPKAKAAKSDQRFIHSTLGFSYLTLHVMDLDASMKQLKDAKIPFEGETPVALGGNNALLVVRDPDGNFVELIGPRRSASE